jgi:aldose 1-epimerase
VEIIELSRGRTRAVVVPEAGGRLHQLSIHDGLRWLPLLRGPSSLSMYLDDPAIGGSYAMAPWPGRIDGGRFLWRGRMYAVPTNAGTHSLHGRAVYLTWRVESRTTSTCRLSLSFDSGWPWPGRAVHDIALHNDGMTQRLRVEATSGAAFPVGLGWHPWFRRAVGGRSGIRVRVDADRHYELTDMVPTGWLPRVNAEVDLRGYPALGTRRIDACYRRPRGPMRIRWGEIELTMRSSPNVTHAVVYTPKQAVCVEPQTCAPDAFNLAAQGVDGAGMAMVDRRQPLSASTTWRWTIGAGAR